MSGVEEKEEERKRVDDEKAGKELAVGRRKRRSHGEANKLSVRQVFVLQELLKVRRMTQVQLARLCRIENAADASRSLRRRLEGLGVVSSDDAFRDGKKVVLKLNEPGHRYACELFLDERMKSAWHYREAINPDSLLHLLKTTDLYVDIIARSANDWLEVREMASRFTWVAFNENIAFRWKEPAALIKRDTESDKPYLLPDAVMETGDKRFLIELERPTKTLGAAFRKIDQYNRLFSITRSVGDQSPYRQKYYDDLQPVVVFVFDCRPDDVRRADNFRREMVRRQTNEAARFFIPAWEVKSLGAASEYLRDQLGASLRPRREEDVQDEVRRFVVKVLNSGISSLDWPENWRTVGQAIYPMDEWSAIHPRLEKRFAEAVNRKLRATLGDHLKVHQS